MPCGGGARPPKPELEEERARKAAKAAAEAESLGLALGTLEYAADDDDDEENEEDDEDEEGAEGAEELTDARDAPASSAGEPTTENEGDHDDARLNPSTGRMNYVEAFDPEELVRILLKAKGADVVVIPVKEKCNWTDHFVVGTAKSPRHIRMLAGAVLHAVKKRTRFIVGNKLQPAIEGADAGDGRPRATTTGCSWTAGRASCTSFAGGEATVRPGGVVGARRPAGATQRGGWGAHHRHNHRRR